MVTTIQTTSSFPTPPRQIARNEILPDEIKLQLLSPLNNTLINKNGNYQQDVNLRTIQISNNQKQITIIISRQFSPDLCSLKALVHFKLHAIFVIFNGWMQLVCQANALRRNGIHCKKTETNDFVFGHIIGVDCSVDLL